MINSEIEKKLKFEAVLGWLGITGLKEVNDHFGIFQCNGDEYILYKTISGDKCLRLRTLSSLTTAQFLLLNIPERTPLQLEKSVKKVSELSKDKYFKLPEFQVVKESQILPNLLQLDDAVDYSLDEESNPLFFQFLNTIECIDIQFFTCKRDWEFCGCIYHDSRFINAIRFNMGISESILTRNSYLLSLKKSEKSSATIVSDINHLIHNKLFLEDNNLFLFKSFIPAMPSLVFDYDKISFIITEDDYQFVFQSLLNHLVSTKVFSSASISVDQENKHLTIHISGYGKKPFTIDQLSEPIKQLIRGTLNPWGQAGKDPHEKFLLEEDYFFASGDLIQEVNSKANDQILTMPLKKEILVPLFTHYGKLTNKKLMLHII